MTIDALANWPDDPDDPFNDEFDSRLDCFDDRDDHRRREGLCATLNDPPASEDELYVEMLIDRNSSRLSDVYTRGLWDLGVPELCVSPPSSFNLAGEHDWGRLAVLLGTALIHLGGELLAADHFDVPPYLDEFDGRPVQLWLRGQEPVEGRLALALDDVDTLLRVECSLWATPQPART